MLFNLNQTFQFLSKTIRGRYNISSKRITMGKIKIMKKCIKYRRKIEVNRGCACVYIYIYINLSGRCQNLNKEKRVRWPHDDNDKFV